MLGFESHGGASRGSWISVLRNSTPFEFSSTSRVPGIDARLPEEPISAASTRAPLRFSGGTATRVAMRTTPTDHSDVVLMTSDGRVPSPPVGIVNRRGGFVGVVFSRDIVEFRVSSFLKETLNLSSDFGFRRDLPRNGS